jgi:AFG3 family protein
VTKMAYAQIVNYGMNDKVGHISFSFYGEEKQSFQKPYSEETGRIIDEEVRKLIDGAYIRTREILLQKKDDVEKVAKILLEKEVLNRDDMLLLLGPRPFPDKSLYDELIPQSPQPTDEPDTDTPKKDYPSEGKESNLGHLALT